MQDWRITKQAEFLMGKTFQKIVFPTFWESSYRERNEFYKMIAEEAFEFVKEQGRGEEYLDGDKIQIFWHQHCDFCTEKISTDKSIECYCADGYKLWVCKKCFDDFKGRFNWNVSSEQ